jgi:hypothetical protein
MIRTVPALLIALALTTAAWADVAVKSTNTGKGLAAVAGTIQATTYIKGMRMRSDSVTGDTTRTTIFDVDAQKMYIFDNKKKEADVWDMAAFGAEMSKSVDVSEMKASIKPNGKTKEIAGRTATGYDVEISMPATMGGQGGMKMTVILTGPTWIVKNAPGAEDYMRFYKGAAEKGWIFSDPKAAKGSPGQAKVMSEMYKQFAAIGGIPYEQEMEIKMSMDGGQGNPLAGLFGKMGGMSMTTSVQSVETGALADDLFAPPAGYKLKQNR